MQPDDIIPFWFGEPDEPYEQVAPRWWTKDPAFDARIAEQFGDHLVPAAAGRYRAWEDTPDGTLALVVLLDQFPRNIHRGSPLSFAFDAAARDVARRAVRRGVDRLLEVGRRPFVYMPLMHSEDIADHREALVLFEALEAAAQGGPLMEMMGRNCSYQRQHSEIILRFGRYPHRNQILGRQSTPEELAFLQEDGSSF